MTDALSPLFADRTNRLAVLPDEQRLAFESLEKNSGDPMFADRQFSALWMSKRTGLPQEEVLKNFDGLAARYFGEGTTPSQAYDRISATYKPQGVSGQGEGGESAPEAKESAMQVSGSVISKDIAGSFAGGASRMGYDTLGGFYANLASATGVTMKRPQDVEEYQKLYAESKRYEIESDMLDPLAPLLSMSMPFRRGAEAGSTRRSPEEWALVTQREAGAVDARKAEITARLNAIREQVQAENMAALEAAQGTFMHGYSENARSIATTMYDLSKGSLDAYGVRAEFQDTTVGQLVATSGSLPVTALYAALGPYLGAGGIYTSIYGQVEQERMQAEGEAYDPQAAFLGNLASAGPQAALEFAFGMERIMGKVINLSPKVGGKIAFGDAARLMGKTGLTVGFEEALTEPSQGWINDWVASLTYDEKRELFTPDVLKTRLVEGMSAFALSFFFGLGVQGLQIVDRNRSAGKAERFLTTRDGQLFQAPDFAALRTAKTDEELRAMAGDPSLADTLVAAANGNPDAQASYRQQVLSKMFVETDGLSAQGFTLGKAGEFVAVRDESGRITTIDPTDPIASAFLKEVQGEAVAKNEATQATIDEMQRRFGSLLEVEKRAAPVKLSELRKQGVITGEQQADALAAAADINEALGEDAMDAVVMGSAKLTRSETDGLLRMVINVAQGAEPTVAIEEVAESWYKKAVEEGRNDPMALRGYREQWHKDNGEADPVADGRVTAERADVEWFSKRVIEYAIANRKTELPGGWGDWLRTLGERLRKLLRGATRMKKMLREGKITPELEAWFQAALGNDQAMEKQTPRAQRQAELEAVFSQLPPEAQQIAQEAENKLRDYERLKNEYRQQEALQMQAQTTADRRQDAAIAEGLQARMRDLDFARAQAEQAVDEAMNLPETTQLSAQAQRMMDQWASYSLAQVQGERGGMMSTFSLDNSRAQPADASNVIMLPDGAQLVGPTTFSITALPGDSKSVENAGYAAGSRIAAEAKVLADFVESPAFESQGLGGLDVPSQRAVMLGVFRVGHDLKVLNAVIELIPVDVMDMLRAKELTPKMLFEDQAVFEKLFIPDGNGTIAEGGDSAASLLRAVALGAAKSGASDFAGAAVNDGSANSAGDVHILNQTRDAAGSPTFSLVAFHGTPHKVDKFKTANIGTGEGAQAYGWGLYFAESKAVAGAYQKGLTERDFIAKVREVYAEGDDAAEAVAALKQAGISEAQRRLVTELEKEDWLGFDYPHQAVQAVIREPQNFDLSDGVRAALDKFGSLYTVELLPDADAFLDWDAPLSGQNEAVKAKVRAMLEKDGWGAFLKAVDAFDAGDTKAMKAAGYSLFDYVGTVGSIYQTVASDVGEKKLSLMLAKAGIPGIRYLDQQSRVPGMGKYRVGWNADQTGAEVTDMKTGAVVQSFSSFREADAWVEANADASTRNYVIFDEKLVRILEENGKPAEQSPTFSLSPDYGIEHRPRDDGPRAFDLSENNMMPADVYEHPEWYSAMSPKVIRETMAQLRKVRGKPDGDVTIYRAGPAGEMNPGDWVSLSREYARTHADSQDPEGYKVWAQKVKAEDVKWSMDDLSEFGYFGEKVEAKDVGVTFSLTNSKEDAKYLELAKDVENNREALQGMVDEAAEKAGFDTSTRFYWGSRTGGRITNIGAGLFITDDLDAALDYAHSSLQSEEKLQSFYLRGAIAEVEDLDVDWTVRAWDEYDPIGSRERTARDMDFGAMGANKRLRAEIKAGGFTALHFTGDVSSYGQIEHDSWNVVDPKNIKSADPVEYDDAGNVIPLSRRFVLGDDLRGTFDPADPDITFSLEDITFAVTGIPQNRRQQLQRTFNQLHARQAALFPYPYQQLAALPVQAKVSLGGHEAGLAGRVLLPVSERLRFIADKAGTRIGILTRVRRYYAEKGTNLRRYSDQVTPLMRGIARMSTDDLRIFGVAASNQDAMMRNSIIAKYGLQNEWASYEAARDALRNEMIAAGMEVGDIGEYFPRWVKDVTGLRESMGINASDGVLEQAVIDAEKAAGRPLRDEEVNAIIDGVVRGVSYGAKGGSAPSNTKQRKIVVIQPNQWPFYADPNQALSHWLNQSTEAIARYRFFGKAAQQLTPQQVLAPTASDLDVSIGTILAEEVAAGNLPATAQAEVKAMLDGLFSYHGRTNAWIRGFMDLSYWATMGKLSSALAQATDLMVSVYEAGPWNTFAAIPEAMWRNAKALPGIGNSKTFSEAVANFTKGKDWLTREELGIDRIMEEFNDQRFTTRALNQVFTATGLNFMDGIGKDVLLNAKFRQLTKQSVKGQLSASNQRMIEGIFGKAKAVQVIADFRANRKNADTIFAVYNVLADWQPISLAEYPESYAKNPNARVLYMLKSYSIKMLAAYRREGLMKMWWGSPEQKMEGARNLAYLLALLFMAGASKDWLVDFMLDRDPQPDDIMVDNIFKLMQVSRYALWQQRNRAADEGIYGGVGAAAEIAGNIKQIGVDLIAPPFTLIERPMKDVKAWAKASAEYEPWSFWESESIQFIPVAGEFLYWTGPTGQGKIERRRALREAEEE